MRKILHFFTAFGIAALALAADPTPPEKYELLFGEDFAGSGFVIRHDNRFFGVTSLHQFDGKTPRMLEPLEGDKVMLDTAKVIKQLDAQAIPVKSSNPKLQFLRYNPSFTLRLGDEVIIFGPAGDRVSGILTAKGMTAGAYDSADGPRELEARASKPLRMAGGSGGPIVHKPTGSVIGILLTADDANQARVVGFETLCLSRPITPLARYKTLVSRAVGSRWDHHLQSQMAALKVGTVEVSFTIDEAGRLQSFSITSNTSNAAHAKLIEQSVKECTFESPPPEALKDGIFAYQMKFNLQ